ncbi:hypothetical protein EUX98_g7114 [Antrodiella citrinella]|uniref:HNH nuclease domain-containing protein n=1 Tax=Antrodiella citrinella TaxID=2447956 RepID=A0A4S4MMC9_9APHY|nr:hypothetical protein EUX98_g7114 [Antrodiella citrinella]
MSAFTSPIESRSLKLNVLAVGKFIQNYLIRPLKRNTTPKPPYYTSKITDEQVKCLLEATPTLYSVAKKQALIRDGYRCMACGVWDRRGPDYMNPSPGFAVWTRCAHIVPESITMIALSSQPTASDTANELELDYSTTSLRTILRCFGCDIDTITGRTVHSLHNIMTLEVNVRDAFDRLDLWFVATAPPHCYTFDKLPLPSPELLLLHATCAEVAHLSGTTAYMDKNDLKIEEDADVLAEDGGSAELLQHAILSRLGNSIHGSDL